MKYFFGMLFFCQLTFCSFSQETKQNISTSDLIAFFVEEEAEFIGGLKALNAYLDSSLLYPFQDCLSGKCYTRFVINVDGTISDVKVLRGIPGCEACNKEAIRVIMAMPKWKPAKNQGKIVACYFNLAIDFSIDR
jgi:protein TonB